MTHSTHESPAATPADRHGEPLFARVLCGIDGSPASLEAARQAALLGGRRSARARVRHLDHRRRADRDDRARRAARPRRAGGSRDGRRGSVGATSAGRAWSTPPTRRRRCWPQASDADLAVVGTHGGSRQCRHHPRQRGLADPALGARGPVLVARPPAGDSLPFPSPAGDATGHGAPSRAAAARRHASQRRFESSVILLRVGSAAGCRRAPRARGAGRAICSRRPARSPRSSSCDGKPADRIVETARARSRFR